MAGNSCEFIVAHFRGAPDIDLAGVLDRGEIRQRLAQQTEACRHLCNRVDGPRMVKAGGGAGGGGGGAKPGGGRGRSRGGPRGGGGGGGGRPPRKGGDA